MKHILEDNDMIDNIKKARNDNGAATLPRQIDNIV